MKPGTITADTHSPTIEDSLTPEHYRAAYTLRDVLNGLRGGKSCNTAHRQRFVWRDGATGFENREATHQFPPDPGCWHCVADALLAQSLPH